MEKLEGADLLEPVGTRYARNGQEATAYGSTRQATAYGPTRQATVGYLFGLRSNDDPGVRPSRRSVAMLGAYVVVIVAVLAGLQFRWIVLPV